MAQRPRSTRSETLIEIIEASIVSDEHPVVAVGLLTERDLSVLGQGFRRIFRIDEHHDFSVLLAAIDEAERHQAAARAHMPMPSPR